MLVTCVFSSLLVSAVFLSQVGASNSPCDKGYIYYETENSCVLIVKEPATWKQAKQNCEQQAGNLVMIDNDSKNAFVATHVNTRNIYWIGARRFNTSSFSLVDGREVTYTNWKNGQPDNFLMRERCVMMYGYDRPKGAAGFWNDLNCRKKIPYLCERKRITNEETTSDGLFTITPYPNLCPEGWKKYKDDETCLKYLRTKTTNMMNYMDVCDRGRPVTIRDSKKNSFVADMVNTTKARIGISLMHLANDTVIDYGYEVDHERLGTFQPWSRSSNNLDPCVAIAGKGNQFISFGQWFNIPCTRQPHLGVVCEIKYDRG